MEKNRTMRKIIWLRKLFPFVVIFVFIWGIALRAVETLNGNYLFGFDQGRDYLAAYNIVVNHKLTLIGAEVGAGSAGLTSIFHGPGYYYLISLAYILFNGDPYGGLLVMFIFGIATLVASYLCFSKMFGKLTGLIMLALVSISPFIMTQSRFLWNHHLSTVWIVLTLYFAYLIPKKPRLYAPLAIFTAGIIYHFELAIAVPLVIAVGVSLVLVYRVREIKTYGYSLVALCAAFSPFFLFEMRHGWMAFRSIFQYISTASFVNSAHNLFWMRVIDHVGSYASNARNSFLIDFGYIPTALYTVFICILLGAAICISIWGKNKSHRVYFRFLLTVLLVSYSVFLLLNNSIWNYYLLHAHIIYMLIFAYIVGYCIRSAKGAFVSIGSIFVILVFLVSMTMASVKRMQISYSHDYQDFGGIEKIRGKKIAIDTVYQEANGKPFNVFTFMAPVYTYPYDYLFLTYGKDRYGYIPGNEKRGDVYLIIEPDNQDWYKGWLETIIKDGTVVNTEQLSTGHIIQHRIFP